MSIPDELLWLAIQEFPTFEDAIAASGQDRVRIPWAESETPDNNTILPVPSDLSQIPMIVSVTHKFLTLTKSSVSGDWVWVPSHPEDVKLVRETKAKKQVFGNTKVIFNQHKISKDMIDCHRDKEDYQNYIEAKIKSMCFEQLAKEADHGKNYKINYSLKKELRNFYGNSDILELTGMLTFSEEIC